MSRKQGCESSPPRQGRTDPRVCGEVVQSLDVGMHVRRDTPASAGRTRPESCVHPAHPRERGEQRRFLSRGSGGDVNDSATRH